MLIVGLLVVVVGLVALVAGAHGGVVVALFVLGALVALTAVLRRFGRKGNFSRSGWTGS